MARLKICALGSSFASGQNIIPYADSVLGRSLENYPHLLAQKLESDGIEVELTDLSCSGATLHNILSQPQDFGVRLCPPQLDGLPADADIVTLTAGGNDMQYSMGMAQDSYSVKEDIVATLSDLSGDGADQVAKNLIAIIDRVKAKASKAHIYLVEYVNIFGRASTRPGADTPLSPHRIAHWIKIGGELRTAFRMAAKARPKGVTLLPVGELSKGHELGAAEPWVGGWSLFEKEMAVYHPNAAAHVGIAEELYSMVTERIGKGVSRK